ncbi:phytoene/squalene synthase family protein [Rhodoferax lacus]|uniref:Phytoene/squalene synthase family protein n=1 Tax=Rhodoferax lacus TaxID=2184758 RepID=A0A3E1RCP5_9BURK|nr:phytoene/squalene synthase family protein [Rhodoferax lacus]RFO97043.1 phytoene/squalene synthase family protein [Rhodoferax lacus]
MPTASPEYAARDLKACIAMMQGGSKTFFAASRLLPLRVRAASIALYAFCRVADDLVDEGGNVDANLQMLRQRLDLIYAGTPSDSVEDQALAIVVQQHQLPRMLLDALLEGFAWDATGRRYDTLEDLHGYCARVAGTVGAMMCWIMGSQSERTLARACELGVAMQLTNIARDIGEDARNGRLYLPRVWLQEAGVDVRKWLADPVSTAAIQTLTERLLAEADTLYAQAQAGIAELPPDCRAAILAASTIYGEIGQQLRREGLDSIHHRTVVSTRRKLVLLATSWAQAGWITTRTAQPAPLAAIRFLIAGCQADVLERQAQAYFPNRAMPQRVEWVFGLLERLENAKRERKVVGV